MNKLAALLPAACLSNSVYAADKNQAGEDARFEQLFDNIDTDHDGQLTGREIAEFLRAQLKAQDARSQ